MKHGYFQLKIKEESIYLTAFVTPFGHFEYTRVPFGLYNAPMKFQKVMRSLFDKFLFLRVLLDGILIFSDNLEEHIEHLETVMDVITRNNILVTSKNQTSLHDP